MYPLLKLSKSRRLWQSRYCDAEFERCARYERSLRGTPVPPNLMPNGAILRMG